MVILVLCSLNRIVGETDVTVVTVCWQWHGSIIIVQADAIQKDIGEM